MEAGSAFQRYLYGLDAGHLTDFLGHGSYAVLTRHANDAVLGGDHAADPLLGRSR